MIRLQVVLGSGSFLYDKKALKATLRKAGQEVAAGARQRIRAKVGGGKLYRGSGGGRQYRGYKAGHYEASLPGASPVSVTGTLARGIKVIPFRSGEGVAVRDTVFYGLFLEAGAQGGIGGGGRTRAEAAAGIKKKGQRNIYKRATLQAVVGSRVVAPRPFLTVELEADAAGIGARLKAAMTGGLAWQTKPKKGKP